MKSLRFLNLLLGILFSFLLAATSVRGQTTQPPPQPASPVPFIDILAPTSTYPGHGDFVLAISGANFEGGAAVQFDGLTLTPIAVSRNSLTVTVPAAAVASAHTASITIKNPNFNTFDLVKSNVAFFPITQQTAGLVWTAPFSVLGPVNPFNPNPGSPATAFAVGDFNEDGHQDVLVALPGLLQVYAGDGKGNFTAAGSVPTGLGIVGAMEVGDFNNDGNLDVAATNGQTLAIFFNDGAGNFTAGPYSTLPPYGFPQDVINRCQAQPRLGVADINGDGVLDLVFPGGPSTPNTHGVVVLLGDGLGNFTQSSVVSVPAIDPQLTCDVALGDFNGDGWVDIAYASFTPANSVVVAFNDATGGFTSANTFGINDPARSGSLAAGDMSGDGFLDLVGASSQVNIYENQGNSTFAGTGPFVTTPQYVFSDLVLGDLTGAGALDAFTSWRPSASPASGWPLIGNGAAALFSNPVLSGASLEPLSYRLADFNEDGRLDVAYTGDNVVPLNGVAFEYWLQRQGAPVWSVVQHSFGTVILHLGQLSGTPSLLTETLSNSGPAPLDIANICSRNPGPVGIGTAPTPAGSNPCLTGTDSVNFPISAAASTCPLNEGTPGTNAGTIQPGGNCTVAVGFQPTTFGTFSATLSVVDDANSVPGSVQNVTLTGTAIELDANVQSLVNADGSSVFNSQRGVVPVKFTLQENFVTRAPGPNGCQLPPATISITRTAGGTIGPVDTDVFEMAADSGANFRIDTNACQYVYNVDARSLGPGTYNVQIFVNPADLGGKAPGPAGIGSATFGLN